MSQTKNCSYEYTVRRGDSFYLIAHRLGVPLRDLLEANSSVNPARLMVGDVLCIPAAQTAPENSAPAQPAEPAPTEAQQAPSQTGTPDAPAQESAPAPAAEAVPDAAEPDDLLDRPAADAPAAQGTTPVCTSGTAHTVAQGETLSDIQLATGLNLHTLALANPNADLDALREGQVLCIPSQNLPCPTREPYVLTQDDTLESVSLRLNVSIGSLLRANPCMAPGDFTSGATICLP